MEVKNVYQQLHEIKEHHRMTVRLYREIRKIKLVGMHRQPSDTYVAATAIRDIERSLRLIEFAIFYNLALTNTLGPINNADDGFGAIQTGCITTKLNTSSR